MYATGSESSRSLATTVVSVMIHFFGKTNKLCDMFGLFTINAYGTALLYTRAYLPYVDSERAVRCGAGRPKFL